jgi:hypothetical protein
MEIFGTDFLYISSGTKWEQVTELECTFVVTTPPPRHDEPQGQKGEGAWKEKRKKN